MIIALIAPATLNAQFEKISSITHPAVAIAAVDRPGELYLVSRDSAILRYDINGKLQQKGSMPFLPEIFDPHDGARLFAFDFNTKQYLFFTPSFSFQTAPTRPDSAFAIDPAFACASGDRDLVIFDSADGSLKKIDLKQQRMLFESVLPDTAVNFKAITAIREYQNFIFVLDAEKGIRIFNMMGRLLKVIPGANIPYFNFLGEELYYPQGESLHFFNLFTTGSRIIALPHPARFALLTDERLYLVSDTSTGIFSFQP
jgi:hypothetical protein